MLFFSYDYVESYRKCNYLEIRNNLWKMRDADNDYVEKILKSLYKDTMEPD